MSAFIVSVGGPSSSGKTTFCYNLSKKFAEFKVKVISLDNYRTENIGKAVSPTSGVEYTDWSNPEYIDIDKVMACIRDESEKADLIFVEGLCSLYFHDIREVSNLRIYLDASAESRIFRRIMRNTRRDGSSVKSVGEYHLDSARFSEKKYVENTKVFSDLVLDGEFITDRGMSVIYLYIHNAIM